MKFSDYRSKALKALWPKYYNQYDKAIRNLIRQPQFSTWAIDNICANCWKNDCPIDFCVEMLFDYLQEITEDN